ncbi:MAG: hypothetical protein EXR71_18460 [Myxococcales bacterium]|nr:hypothetical protein [Myxococcales bacterium]
MLLLLATTLALAEPVLAEVVLDDGQVLRGTVERQDDGSIILTLGSGTRLRFPGIAIRDVRAIDPKAPPPTPTTPVSTDPLPLPGALPGQRRTAGGYEPDPNRSRYLYSPSAYSLGRGHGYVSQKELIITEAAFGITDFWDIQAGTSVITLALDGGAFALVGSKFSLPVGDNIHLAVGGQALFTSVPAIVLGFGTFTYGPEDRHVSVSVGGLTTIVQGVAGAPTGLLATVSGSYRLGPRTALVTENWILFGGGLSPTGDDVYVVPSLAVRLFGPSFATDLGVVPIITGASDPPVIPIPWIGFTWNWALPDAK